MNQGKTSGALPDDLHRKARDALVGAAALALVIGSLLAALLFAFAPNWGATLSEWQAAWSSILLLVASLAETAGAMTIVVAYIGKRGNRDSRVGVGALMLSGASCAFAVMLVPAFTAMSHLLQPSRSIASLSLSVVGYLLLGARFYLVASAVRHAPRGGAREDAQERNRRLARACVFLAVSFALFVVAYLVTGSSHFVSGDPLTALDTGSLARDVLLVAAAAVAALGFFASSRSYSSESDDGPRRKEAFLSLAGLLVFVGGLAAVVGEISTLRSITVAVPWRENVFLYMQILRDAGLLIAGLFATLGFALSRWSLGRNARLNTG